MLSILIILLNALHSPGDSVGYTKWQWQWNGQTACQIWYDGSSMHVGFTRAHKLDYSDRNCAYNFWLNGLWIGDLPVTNRYAGYVSIGAMPTDNRGVCAYQMRKVGGYYKPWVAIDEEQGAYNFNEREVLPQLNNQDLFYGRMAVDDHGNLHVVPYAPNSEISFYTRSTDEGQSWSDTIVINPETNYHQISTGVFADRLNSSSKVMVYWTQWTTELTGWSGRLCQDIWCMISTDYGETWEQKTNITNFSTSDTIRSYTHVKGIFDNVGNPHMVFAAPHFDGSMPTDRISYIAHWSPNSGISIVTGPHTLIKYPGGGRLPSDYPDIAVDRDNGWLYCIYVLNRDSDTSAIAEFNGEIMAKVSTDNGLTWISNAHGDSGVNLTKTPTPGASPGLCCDDDYPSLYHYVETIDGKKSIIISYLEGRGGDWYNPTNDPYRVYIVPCESVIKVEEEITKIPQVTGFLDIAPNPSFNTIKINYSLSHDSKVRINILDVTGRVVKRFIDRVVSAGYHSDRCCTYLPSGIYFAEMVVEGYHFRETFVIVR